MVSSLFVFKVQQIILDLFVFYLRQCIKVNYITEHIILIKQSIINMDFAPMAQKIEEFCQEIEPPMVTDQKLISINIQGQQKFGSSRLSSSLNCTQNQDELEIKIENPNSQSQQLPSTQIIDKEESIKSQCNNIEDVAQQIIVNIGDKTEMKAHFYENKQTIELICLFFDLQQNKTVKYTLELNNTIIPDTLQGIFEHVGEIFSEVIKQKLYQLEEGAIIIKYQIMKKKELVTKDYRLKMDEVKLSNEQQLLYLVNFLKEKTSTGSKVNEKAISQQQELKYLKRLCSEYCAVIVQDKKLISGDKDEKNDYLRQYCLDKLSSSNIDTKTYQQLQEMCIFYNIILCDQPSNPLRDKPNKVYKLLNSYFKENTKTWLEFQILYAQSKQFSSPYRTFSSPFAQSTGFSSSSDKISSFSCYIYGFKGIDNYHKFSIQQKTSVLTIEVDRFINKVSFITKNGVCMHSEELAQPVIDQQFKIDIRLSFQRDVKLKAKIKRNDFLIKNK